VPVPEFFFSLDLSDEIAFDSMMDEVTAGILRHAGYSPEAVADIAATLRDALHQAAAAGHSRCGVEFSAQGGELRMAVSGNGAGWRAARPLPR
jgi:hypothetical protein